MPPHSVVAPESALGSLASVALSSAQVNVVVAQLPSGSKSKLLLKE